MLIYVYSINVFYRERQLTKYASSTHNLLPYGSTCTALTVK